MHGRSLRFRSTFFFPGGRLPEIAKGSPNSHVYTCVSLNRPALFDGVSYHARSSNLPHKSPQHVDIDHAQIGLQLLLKVVFFWDNQGLGARFSTDPHCWCINVYNKFISDGSLGAISYRPW